MKILVVSRFNTILPSGLTPFIEEQVKCLKKNGCNVDTFTITGKGFMAYFMANIKLTNLLKKKRYDIVHAHYGLTGVCAVLQNKTPVVVSLIGCDVNIWYNRLLNRLFLFPLAKFIIFVSKKLEFISKYNGDSKVVPYGVNFDSFFEVNRKVACNKINLNNNLNNILFASRFDRIEKNYKLSKMAISFIEKEYNINLIEFKNIDSKDLNYYYNACDLFLMTSIKEGSPQSIKEAMACNIPIVSTDVGDVREVIGKTEGCYITSFDPEDVADKIKKALAFGKRTKGREDIKHLESSVVAKRIIDIYKKVLDKK